MIPKKVKHWVDRRKALACKYYGRQFWIGWNHKSPREESFPGISGKADNMPNLLGEAEHILLRRSAWCKNSTTDWKYTSKLSDTETSQLISLAKWAATFLISELAAQSTKRESDYDGKDSSCKCLTANIHNAAQITHTPLFSCFKRPRAVTPSNQNAFAEHLPWKWRLLHRVIVLM